MIIKHNHSSDSKDQLVEYLETKANQVFTFVYKVIDVQQVHPPLPVT